HRTPSPNGGDGGAGDDNDGVLNRCRPGAINEPAGAKRGDGSGSGSRRLLGERRRNRNQGDDDTAERALHRRSLVKATARLPVTKDSRAAPSSRMKRSARPLSAEAARSARSARLHRGAAGGESSRPPRETR